MRRKAVSSQLRGLLEVEPLHFTCCSASEATRVENVDSILSSQNTIIDDILFDSPAQSVHHNDVTIPNKYNEKGEDISMGSVKEILSENMFYTSVTSKIKDQFQLYKKSTYFYL